MAYKKNNSKPDFDHNSVLKHSEIRSYPTPPTTHSVEPSTIGSNTYTPETNHGQRPQPQKDDKK